MKLIYKKKKAVTLLEVVLSIAILAVISIPIGGILITSVRSNKETEDKQIATLLGQQILEEIKVTDFTDTTNLTNGIVLEKLSLATHTPIEYKNTSTTDVNGFTVSVQLIEDKNIKLGDNLSGVANCSDIYISGTGNDINISKNSDGSSTMITFNSINSKLHLQMNDGEVIIGTKEKSSGILNLNPINNLVGCANLKIHVPNTITFSDLEVEFENNTSAIESFGIYFVNKDSTKTTADIKTKSLNKSIRVINDYEDASNNVEKAFTVKVKVLKNGKEVFKGQGIKNVVSN